MDIKDTIRKKSLAEEVAELLQKQITDGKLAKGEKLPPEPELMAMLGVGRSTVREAVKMLANMGYLSVQQGRGTFVKNTAKSNEPFNQRIKRADIQELREVRDILEEPIARFASQRRTDTDIETIRQHLRERGESAVVGSVEGCIQADIKLHTAIARATHNEVLAEVYNSMAAHLVKGYGHIYDDTSDFIETQPLHEELVISIENGNTNRAIDAAKQLWDVAKIKN